MREYEVIHYLQAQMLWQCSACTLTVQNHFEATIRLLHTDYEDVHFYLMCTDKLCTNLEMCINKLKKVNSDFINILNVI